MKDADHGRAPAWETLRFGPFPPPVERVWSAADIKDVPRDRVRMTDEDLREDWRHALRRAHASCSSGGARCPRVMEPARRAAAALGPEGAAGEGEAEGREAVAGWAVAQAKEVVAAGWAASQPGRAATASAQAAAGPRGISKGCPAPTSSVLHAALR